MRMPRVNPNRSIDTIDDFQFSSPSVYTCLRVRMANAQLRSPGPGQATPAHDERESSPAEAVESDNTKVDESEDSQCEVDHIYLWLIRQKMILGGSGRQSKFGMIKVSPAMFLLEHAQALENARKAKHQLIQAQVQVPLVLAPLAPPQALVPSLTRTLIYSYVLRAQILSQKSLKRFLNLSLSTQQKGLTKRTDRLLLRFVPYLILKSFRACLWTDFSRKYFSRVKNGMES